MKPRAFFSCSLNENDYSFNAIIESIILRYGFEIRGGIGRYNFSPSPIPIQMKNEMDISECLVLAGVGRYHQLNIHNQQTTMSMSETMHSEIGMALQKGIPIIAFLAPNVSPGNLLPILTQYINPIYNRISKQYYYDPFQIDNVIHSCFSLINENRKKAENKELVDNLVKIGAVIGVSSIVLSLVNSEDNVQKKNNKRK